VRPPSPPYGLAVGAATVEAARGAGSDENEKDAKRDGTDKKAGVPGDPGHRHDVTPWTHCNRVPLCQATLSIGPYLLLKVQFQRCLFYPDVPALNPQGPGPRRTPTTSGSYELSSTRGDGFARGNLLAGSVHPSGA
jgi:hypothetical protein